MLQSQIQSMATLVERPAVRADSPKIIGWCLGIGDIERMFVLFDPHASQKETRLPPSQENNPLTPRQNEVLELLARGLTNSEIAGVLEIAPATVKVHVSAIIAALHVTNRTEAAMALQSLDLSEEPDPEDFVPGFGRRPTLAVLPFDTFSNGVNEAVFADGLVDDLTTRLSTIRWFPVIARSTAFAFRETPRNLKEISEVLGARYLVEGSTRRDGRRIRMQVQVIDGESGHHVFAEKYDREVDDVFAVQDEIVDAIVGALEPALVRLEVLRAQDRTPARFETWERFQHGMALFDQGQLAPMGEAIDHFESIVADAPNFTPAHSALAMTSYLRGLLLVSETQSNSTSEQEFQNVFAQAADCYQRSLTAGKRATELEPQAPAAWIGFGVGLGMTGDLRSSRGAFERALELNPSSALACFSLASLLLKFDEWRDAIPLYERAIRLSPRDTTVFAFEGALAGTYLLDGRYEEALALAMRSREHETGRGINFRSIIPTSLSLLGRKLEARREVEKIRRDQPDFNLKIVNLLGSRDLADCVAQAFSEAGWELRADEKR